MSAARPPHTINQSCLHETNWSPSTSSQPSSGTYPGRNCHDAQHSVPKSTVAQSNTVVQASGYLNYIGESIAYFNIPNLGWSLGFEMTDAQKQQILAAFASPTLFKVFVFYQGSTINAVQIVSAL